ncbi:MAG TPA: plastocyanin/azurin family copper-binding protein [bacterium]|nr:plastocyanin/azurin family copper-binding protein [bacterium]
MNSASRTIATVAVILIAGGLFWTSVSCNNNTTGGGGTTGGTGGTQQTIAVNGFTFAPATLSAKPGEVIKVVNNDTTTHTVTSESAPNAFDDNGDFDTNDLNGGQEGSIAIPADAVVGGDLFYYCDVHKSDMDTPNGTIHVVAP